MNKKELAISLGVVGTMLGLANKVHGDDFGTNSTGIAKMTQVAPGFHTYRDGNTAETFADTRLRGLGDTYDADSMAALMSNGANFVFADYTSNGALTALENSPTVPSAFDDGYTSAKIGETTMHFAYDAQTGNVFLAQQNGSTWNYATLDSGLIGATDIKAITTGNDLELCALNSSGADSGMPKYNFMAVAQPRNVSFTQDGANVNYTFTTPVAGLEYAVQKSTDLQNWTPALSVIATAPTATYTANQTEAKEFYRASLK